MDEMYEIAQQAKYRFFRVSEMYKICDGWNVWNGSNVPKILHSDGERTDCILLLVLVVFLSKHN